MVVSCTGSPLLDTMLDEKGHTVSSMTTVMHATYRACAVPRVAPYPARPNLAFLGAPSHKAKACPPPAALVPFQEA